MPGGNQAVPREQFLLYHSTFAESKAVGPCLSTNHKPKLVRRLAWLLIIAQASEQTYEQPVQIEQNNNDSRQRRDAMITVSYFACPRGPWSRDCTGQPIPGSHELCPRVQPLILPETEPFVCREILTIGVGKS